MFYELIADSNKNWFLYNYSTGAVAPIASKDIQLFQTLRFRLILSIAIFAVLSLFNTLTIQLSLLISICIFFALTIYYFKHAIPQLKWINSKKVDHLYPFVKAYFSKNRLITRAATLFILTIILFIAFIIQFNGSFTQENILIIILGMILLIESLKQIYLLLTTK